MTSGVLTSGTGLSASAEVDAWAERAGIGEEIPYATGSLTAGAAAPARMRALAHAGIVVLFQRRINGMLHYFARRTAQPFPLTMLATAASKQPATHDEAQRVLLVLKRVAAKGGPCPSNRELAKLAELRDGDQASYRLRCLRDAGLIRMHATAQLPGRQVTIAATGKTTGVLIPLPAKVPA
jgi:hypothetical protein